MRMRVFSHDPMWTRHRIPGSAERLGSGLVVRRFAIPGLRPGARPFRLAFFSDLHWDGTLSAVMRDLVETVNAEGVDAVVFGGDLAAYLQHLPAALGELARLKASRVRIAVRGNRESVCTWLPPAFWRERFAEAGFVYLENESWSDPADPAAPAVAGVDDERGGNADFRAAAEAAAGPRPVITVTHNPDALCERGDAFLGDLVLSGHTHGGQYRLPWLGAVFTSSRYGRQFDRGWRIRRDGTLLYVTAGVGATGPAPLRRRLFCPPELALIHIGGASPRTREAP